MSSRGATVSTEDLVADILERLRRMEGTFASYPSAAAVGQVQDDVGAIIGGGAGAVSDGQAPSTSPVPTARGGPGFIAVNWDAETSNVDAVTFDVHLSRTSGFSAVEENKVGESQGDSFFIRREPGDFPLAYDVTYYVRLVARDVDGSAAQSAEASVQLRKADLQDFAVESLYAADILAAAIETGVLVSGNIRTGNSGARVTLDPTGLRCYDQDGDVTVYLNALTGDATFAGLVTASEYWSPQKAPGVKRMAITPENVTDGIFWISAAQEVAPTLVNSKAYIQGFLQDPPLSVSGHQLGINVHDSSTIYAEVTFSTGDGTSSWPADIVFRMKDGTDAGQLLMNSDGELSWQKDAGPSRMIDIAMTEASFYTFSGTTPAMAMRLFNAGVWRIEDAGSNDHPVNLTIAGLSIHPQNNPTYGVRATADGGSFVGDIFLARCQRVENSAWDFVQCNSDYDGTVDAEFRLRGDGEAFAEGTWNDSGLDYAEYYESASGQALPRGLAVRFDPEQPDKVSLAESGDDIIGVVSAVPSFVGGHNLNWPKKYLRDVYGAKLRDEYGDPLLNPAYDSEQDYVPRSERPEWNIIGLVGQLVAVDDGTCTPGKWAKVLAGGVFGHSDSKTGCRVMRRIDPVHVLLHLGPLL